jgi:kinetochore protein NDC80
LQSGDPTLQNTSNIPQEFDLPLHHSALAFEYYESTYSLWLNLDDDVDKQKHLIEDRYGEQMTSPLSTSNFPHSEKE